MCENEMEGAFQPWVQDCMAIKQPRVFKGVGSSLGFRQDATHDTDAMVLQECEMGKKILFLVLGFGMITAGIAGVATSVIDQRNGVALEQIERIKEEARTAAMEEQRQLDEKRQEIDRLAKNVEEKRMRLEEENRLREERRYRETANEQRGAVATRSKTVIPKAPPKHKEDQSPKKQTVLSKRSEESRQLSAKTSASPRYPATSAPKPAIRDDELERISKKAGLEAARLAMPVKYYNKKTREVILAEPFDYSQSSVRVRVRVWRNERLANDRLVSFSEASLRELRRSRV